MSSNPAAAETMRGMLRDPQRMQSMMNPRTLNAMQQMMQVGATGARL